MALRSITRIAAVIKHGLEMSVGHRCYLTRTNCFAIKRASSVVLGGNFYRMKNKNTVTAIRRMYSSDVVNVEKFTPLFLNMENYLDNTAVVNMRKNGERSLTYRDLLFNSCNLACDLVAMCEIFRKPSQLNGARVAVFCDDKLSLLIGLYGCWLANGVAVPVGPYQMSEVLKQIKDIDCLAILTTEQYQDSVLPVAKDLSIPLKLLKVNEISRKCETTLDFWEIIDSRLFGPSVDVYMNNINTKFYLNNTAVILFDTYSAAKKKYLGTMLTFGHLQERLEVMAALGNWRSSDVSLCTTYSSQVELFLVPLLLPFHHGAVCFLQEVFNAQVVLQELQDEKADKNRLFFTHPEYLKLINIISDSKGKIHLNLEHLHVLNVGRSYSNHDTGVQWSKVTGGTLPYVYDKVECGVAMILTADVSIPKPKYFHKGKLLPGFKGRIVKQEESEDKILCEFDHNGVINAYVPRSNVDSVDIHVDSLQSTGPEIHVDSLLSKEPEAHVGTLQLKGPGIFTRYWKDDDETAKLFTEDGWFKTGDLAQLEIENDDYTLIITMIKEVQMHDTDRLPLYFAILLILTYVFVILSVF